MTCPFCGHAVMQWVHEFGSKVWARCRACGWTFIATDGERTSEQLYEEV